MLTRGSRSSKMPCESCAAQFSVFRRKQVCCECERYYCSACLRREGAYVLCAACKLLSTRPLLRVSIAHLKVRDLQCFLQRQNISTRGCVEKEELVSLCVSHVNSATFRRRGPRARPSPFSSLKGFTNNLNVFINNAFEIRTSAPPPAPASTPAPPPTTQNSNCHNASHAHRPRAPASPPERFTTTPGGERGIEVPVPAPRDSPPAPAPAARVDTADCFEIEDLDDAGWEFVARPADPLPNDSEVLLAESGNQERGNTEGGTPVGLAPAGLAQRLQREHRAASTLELGSTPARAPAPDAVSLQDEPTHQTTAEKEADDDAWSHVELSRFQSAAELEALSVRELKLLLARHRVAARGCLERADLLARARTLYRDHCLYRDELDNLPLEECCKICMAAPLECVLLECGHIAACTRCARQLAECPICRQYVVRAVRCFRS